MLEKRNRQDIKPINSTPGTNKKNTTEIHKSNRYGKVNYIQKE